MPRKSKITYNYVCSSRAKKFQRLEHTILHKGHGVASNN